MVRHGACVIICLLPVVCHLHVLLGQSVWGQGVLWWSLWEGLGLKGMLSPEPSFLYLLTTHGGHRTREE